MFVPNVTESSLEATPLLGMLKGKEDVPEEGLAWEVLVATMITKVLMREMKKIWMVSRIQMARLVEMRLA